MSLQAQIDERMKKAMIEKDELNLPLMRMLKSVIKNAEIEKGEELDDAEVISVLEKQAKQRKDSIEQYEAGDRKDLADHEKAELAIILEFLPEKMGEDEIREVVKAKIAEMAGADFGKVMGASMAELKGKADGGTVQRIVKEEMDA
jgi:uncharacterized protein YqeY